MVNDTVGVWHCSNWPRNYFSCVPRVAAEDSGKPVVDAAFGEVMVTCEKIAWLLREGERHLRPERRSSGVMVIVSCPVSQLRFAPGRSPTTPCPCWHPATVKGALVVRSAGSLKSQGA